MGKPIAVHCKGVNLYLVDCLGGKLLVDSGWPDCLQALKDSLKPLGIKLGDIRYVMMTHAHPDHAGMVQILKRLCGTRFLIHETQVAYVEELNVFFARKHDKDFEPLRVEKGDLVVGKENRAAMQAIGVAGEMVETPGHSDDSVSLALDEGYALVGDLTRPDMATEEKAAVLKASWQRLLDLKVEWIYAGHGMPISAQEIRRILNDLA